MPIPPWFARALPGIGMAVTAAYVGYEVYKHLQPHQQQSEEETIQLSRTVDAAAAQDDDAEERNQLCKWLELPYDALDHVPAHRLNVCLVLLQYIPVPARGAFLAMFIDKMETDHAIELLSVLLESMDQHQHDDGDNNDSAAICKEQTVVLLKQTEQPVEILLHTLEVCPAEQRPTLLNRLYILWNTNQLDTLLMQLPHQEPTRLFPMVEALVQTSEESTLVLVEVLSCLHNDPERLTGFLRALRITDHQRDVLLHKLSSLSMERLQQVTLCCAKFADAQVQSMVDTLILATVPPTRLSYTDHPSSASSVVSSIVELAHDNDNVSILS